MNANLEFSVLNIVVGVALFFVTFAGSIIVIAILLVRIPVDYFRSDRVSPISTSHPALKWTGRILKNMAGYAVISLGLAMSMPLVPGQGFLTILIGLMLIDFPGKQRLERALISRPRILRTVNRIRQRYGRESLHLN